MDKKDLDLLSEKNLVPKGNPWLISLKTVPLPFFYACFVTRVLNLVIDNFSIALIVLMVILIILPVFFQNKLIEILTVYATHEKEFSSLFIFFCFFLLILISNFNLLPSLSMIGIFMIIFMIIWRKEILNKLKKIN